jgi:hypothetical protein
VKREGSFLALRWPSNRYHRLHRRSLAHNALRGHVSRLTFNVSRSLSALRLTSSTSFPARKINTAGTACWPARSSMGSVTRDRGGTRAAALSARRRRAAADDRCGISQRSLCSRNFWTRASGRIFTKLREGATRDYIWTLFDSWDMRAWVRQMGPASDFTSNRAQAAHRGCRPSRRSRAVARIALRCGVVAAPGRRTGAHVPDVGRRSNPGRQHSGDGRARAARGAGGAASRSPACRWAGTLRWSWCARRRSVS